MRRRAVALLVVLLPILIISKAVFGGSDQQPTPAPITSTSVQVTPTPETRTSTGSATATANVTAAATLGKSVPDCRNRDISLSVGTDADTYAIGTPVTISMRITNTGSAACMRDVGALVNEIYVTDVDGSVVWSSDACQTDTKPEVVTMQPGRTFGNSQIWGGANSGRDCTQAAADATAGTYLAYARNDTVQSKPFSFTLA